MNPETNMVGLCVFLFGLCWGSFMNVIVYRFNHNKSPWKGRSFCPKCKKAIRWYDNIPLCSFLVLGGRCRDCRSPISAWYPLGEFVVGLAWVILFSVFGLEPVSRLLFLFFVSWLLVGILISDLRYQTIPDYLSYAVAASGLIRVVTVGDVGGLLAGLGVTLFFYLLYVGTKKKGMGLGDVKLVPGLGFLLGLKGVIVALYVAFLSGALIGVVLILLGRKKFGQKVAFGPFLIFGAAVAFGWADGLIEGWFKLLGGG